MACLYLNKGNSDLYFFTVSLMKRITMSMNCSTFSYTYIRCSHYSNMGRTWKKLHGAVKAWCELRACTPMRDGGRGGLGHWHAGTCRLRHCEEMYRKMTIPPSILVLSTPCTFVSNVGLCVQHESVNAALLDSTSLKQR